MPGNSVRWRDRANQASPAKVIRQPQMLKLGKSSATAIVTSAPGRFVSAQSGADSGVAAADDEKMHDDPWRIDAILETTVSLRFKALTKRRDLKSA